MKSASTGYALVMAVIVGTIIIVILAAGGDEFAGPVVSDIFKNLAEAMGVNPKETFRKVSLGTEAGAYAELLVNNRFLQYYFLGVGLTALLAVVLFVAEHRSPTWKSSALFVAFLLLLLLPIAVANLAFGQFMAHLWLQLTLGGLLVLLGSFASYELIRVRTESLMGRALQPVVVLVVLAEGVALPLLYGFAALRA